MAAMSLIDQRFQSHNVPYAIVTTNILSALVGKPETFFPNA